MPNPKIIAVVSGKGGVGKTMLAVAIANEVSASNKTLMIDFDFFNRGLTGLFASTVARGKKIGVDAPSLFSQSTASAGDQPDAGSDWSVVELKPNLSTLHYADLDKDKLDALESLDTSTLSDELKAYLLSLSQQFGFDVVVLDCHGGPDNTSFAACLLADHSILVSEPDRITLHGTLNFLRTLGREAPGASPNVHLVFNKVVPAFSSLFLSSFYKHSLLSEFGGRPLLAAIPLEIYLTKAFEQMPFLTAVYPHSQLAEKSRLILWKLFHADKHILPRNITNMGRWRRFAIEYYMGRWPKVLNLDFVIKAIATYTLLFFGGGFIIQGLGLDHDQVLTSLGLSSNILPQTFVPFLLWFLITLVLNWTKDLDVFLVYNLRRRSFLASGSLFFILVVLWSFVSPLLTLIMKELVQRRTMSDSIASYSITVTSGIAILAIIVYAGRGVRSIVIDRQQIEGILRLSLVAIVFAWVAYALYRIGV